jgi:hypothetical protein
MDLPPRDADDVVQQSGGQPVTADTTDGLRAPVVGELHGRVTQPGDATTDEQGDGGPDLVRISRQTTLQLVTRRGEPRLLVLEQDLERFGREVLDVVTSSAGVDRRGPDQPEHGRSLPGVLGHDGHRSSAHPRTALVRRLVARGQRDHSPDTHRTLTG